MTYLHTWALEAFGLRQTFSKDTSACQRAAAAQFDRDDRKHDVMKHILVFFTHFSQLCSYFHTCLCKSAHYACSQTALLNFCIYVSRQNAHSHTHTAGQWYVSLFTGCFMQHRSVGPVSLSVPVAPSGEKHLTCPLLYPANISAHPSVFLCCSSSHPPSPLSLPNLLKHKVTSIFSFLWFLMFHSPLCFTSPHPFSWYFPLSPVSPISPAPHPPLPPCSERSGGVSEWANGPEPVSTSAEQRSESTAPWGHPLITQTHLHPLTPLLSLSHSLLLIFPSPFPLCSPTSSSVPFSPLCRPSS